MLISESELKAIIRKAIIQESSDSPLYTGFVFDTEDSQTLRKRALRPLAALGAVDWLTSKAGDHGIEQLNHHVTISTKRLKPVDPLRQRLGESHAIKFISLGIDTSLGVAVWGVELPPGFLSNSGIPHSTCALANSSVKPFLAKEIKNWTPIERPFSLVGVFQEVRELEKL